jgi:hypothetical protein
MYGLKKSIAAIAVVAVAVVGVLPVFGDDPCSQANGTALSTSATGVRTWNGTVSATTVGGSGDDAYGVEAWTNSGGSNTKLIWFGPNQGGGYAFRAEWPGGSDDYLGRFGYFWGNGGKKWNALGDLCVDYNYKRSGNGTGGSYSYIGVYGWTIGSSNSAEYYIVEDWYGSGQQQSNNLGDNCQKHGNITVDGKTYEVVTCIRPQGSGCVSCNNQAFGQVFSIRQGMANNSNKCGTISIKKHFEEWTKMTTEKGGQSPAKYIYDKTYESKFLAEAASGNGWFEATYMKFSRTGGCGVTIPAGSYTLTVNTSPSNGGTVKRTPDSSSYKSGSTVTVTATAASGWQFDSWDGATGTTNPLTVTMNENKTITAKFVPVTSGVTTNFVKNGNFESTSDWTLNKWQNSSGTFAVSGGNANITGIGLPSGENASITSLQLVQNRIQLVQGVKYQVSFEASAASARRISMIMQMDIDPWTGYFSKDTINLTTTKQAFTYEFEMTAPSDDNARIAFNFGNATPNVTISNVKIIYASSTGIAPDRRVTPTAAAKPTLRAASVSSGVKVSFKASESGAATLRLYSLKGDVMSTVNLQTVSGKSYTHTLRSNGKLPSGFYMVGLQHNGGAVERMAVLVQ